MPLQANVVPVVVIYPSVTFIALDKVGLDLDLFGKNSVELFSGNPAQA